MKSKWILVAIAAATLLAAPAALLPILQTNAAIGKQSLGFFLLPTNQLLQPWGEQAAIKGRPVDAALDAAKHRIAVLNTRDVELFDTQTGEPQGRIPTHATSYAGIAFRPGSDELWISETARGNSGDALAIVHAPEHGQASTPVRIEIPNHAVPTGIAFSADGRFAYVALSRTNTVAVIDATTHQIAKQIDSGIAPFGVSVSTKTGKVFVTNRGGRRPSPTDMVAPTSGSQAVTDPRTGSSVSGTVTIIDQETFATREIPVGLAPSGMALSPDETLLVITNGHSDTVSILNTRSLDRTDLKLPTWPEGLIGAQPVAATFSPAGDALYVACGGTNAIVEFLRAGKSWTLAGALPTGWFPTAVAALQDGTLRVVNLKGTGNTSNGKGAFNSTQYEGSVERFPQPSPAQWTAGLREVEAANCPKLASAGGVQNLQTLGIQHVLFIVKENRTYDQVFGDLSQANSDPKYLMYGRPVTPNHHALAEQYVILDNFYTGGAISFDGHQWLMQSFVSDYTERAFAASPRGYAWNMSDALTVSPAGFFWQVDPKSSRPQPSIRIYGEFGLPARWDAAKQSTVDMNETEALSWTEYWRLYKENKWQEAVGARSGVPAVAKYLDTRYPNDDTSIPDQIRASEYLRELAEFEQSGNMPQINVLLLNNDHTNGTRPGSPTPRAMVADDDLALGRIIEGLSKSRFWPSTLVLVVEDDAQNGLDHVDGHRTVALAIGPHIRRQAVDSNHYNHGSMVRTIQDIFRIPPQTRFVENARPMTSIFEPESHPAPYHCLTPEIALDEMNPPLKALRGRARWSAAQSLAMNWREPDDVPQDVLNHILWWDSKGYATEYPRR